MSMISAQCDRLRELAIRANELHEYEMERELDQAADTIWELRCKLAGMVDMSERARLAEVENAKLRTLLSDALILLGFNERQYLDKYLREEEGTTLFRELKSVGIEVS